MKKNLLIIVLSIITIQLHAQPGVISALQKISATEGDITAEFGISQLTYPTNPMTCIFLKLKQNKKIIVRKFS